MKRPLGWIGLSFLSILAVIFWLGDAASIVAVCLSAAAVVAGVVFKLLRRGKHFSTHLMAIGLTAFAAVGILFLYQNYYMQPTINTYADKAVDIKGYVCEEIALHGKLCTYLVKTEEIDGEPVKLNIQINAYEDYEVEEFDEVKAHVFLQDSGSEKLYSRRIFLSAYQDDDFTLAATGNTHHSPYRAAVAVRKGIKRILSDMLSNHSAGVTRAILLGDKDALSDTVRSDFTKTGTSFLIVVSGLHLSVVVGMVIFLLRNRSRWIRWAAALVTLIVFTAVTGFAPSVMRAAICVGITYTGFALLRTADGINSLGVAALALTVWNPCAVGDVGILLSFAATFGILLWANPIYLVLRRPIHKGEKESIVNIKRICNYFLRTLAASIAGSLWTLPITAIAFGSFSPLVVVISLITAPLASLILIMTVALVILSVFPSFHLPAGIAAFVLEFLCRGLTGVNAAFAAIPFSRVKADEPFVFVWLGVSAVLVIVGYIVRRKHYVPLAIAASALTLSFGWLFASVLADTATTLTVYQSGSGGTIVARRLDDISLLGCSGQKYVNRQVADRLELISGELDCLVLPNKYYYWAQTMPYLNAFAIDTAVVYENDSINQDRLRAAGVEPFLYDKDMSFSVVINSDVSDRIISTESGTFQYLSGKGTTALIIQRGADAEDLPEEYCSADAIFFDGNIKNAQRLRCHTLIYFGKAEDAPAETDVDFREAVRASDGAYTFRLE